MEEFVSLDIPARGEFVVLCRLALAGLLRNHGFSEDAVADLKLAVTEACTNSIRHAYDNGGSNSAQVHIQFRVLPDRVVMVVEDEGVGIVADDHAEPVPWLGGAMLPTEGGMGMSLIRAVVDNFLLEQPEQGGTRLTLTKLCDVPSV